MLIWVIVILVVAGLVFVRFAPTDPARWHVPVAAQADKDMEGGAIRVLEGGPDDLKRISGVGPKLEGELHRMGVYHFDQVAAWQKKEVAWMDENLEGVRGRVSRDDWVGQARALLNG